MTDSKLAIAEAILGYNFSRKTLALEALMMDSGPSGIKAVVWHKGQRHEVPKNTRLAVVGDGLLDSVLAEAWYGTDESKDRWRELRFNLTRNQALAERGQKLGLGAAIIPNSGSRVSPGMIATTMEALIGAVFRDCGGGGKGYDEVTRVMQHLGFFEQATVNATRSRKSDVKGEVVLSVL